MLGLAGPAARAGPHPTQRNSKRQSNCDFHHGAPVALFETEYFDFRNARPAAFIKTGHRDLHVTDLSGILELQVVDLRRGGGVGLIAQEGPILPVGRAFDFIPIPFSIEGPADLATGKVERSLADRPATTPARSRVRRRHTNRCPGRRRWPGPRYVHRSQSTSCRPACSRRGCPGRRRRSEHARSTGRKEPATTEHVARAIPR